MNYCDLFTELTGERLCPSDLVSFDTTQCVPKRFSKLASKLWECPELYDHVFPVENSQRYIKLLSENPMIELFMPTVSSYKVVARKFQYIARNFPWIPEDHIIIISDKRLLNLDILAEDNPAQLEGGKFHKLLYSTTWNQNYNASFNGMVRCNDWDEIYNEVMRIVEAKQKVFELIN